MPISKRQIALFHTAKAKTGMTNDEKRALLESLGVSSTRDLTQEKLDLAMAHFKKLGFVGTRKFYRPAGSKQRLMAKLMAIRDDLGLTDNYIDAIVQRRFKNKKGVSIPSYRWLDAKQLYKVVQMLSYHQARSQMASSKKPERSHHV